MDNETIIITGNRKGIGRHLTEYYISKGYNVVGCSRTQSDFVHPSYHHVVGDVSNEQTAKEVVSEAKIRFDKIDILINNAGIASMNHSLLTPGSSAQKIINTNFLGSFYFSRECAKQMIKNKTGRIVNFSTVAVPLNLEGEMVYASSKSAVEKMTKILAKELSSYNITVNGIGPTPILTDLIKVIKKSKIDSLLEQQTLKRMGNFDDIENVIDFFISKRSNFITGQIIYLGGL